MKPNNVAPGTNPFAGILNQFSQTAQGIGNNPSSMSSQGPVSMGASTPSVSPQIPSMGASQGATQGTLGSATSANSGTTKFLAGALNSLNSFLSASVDPTETKIVRGLIQVLAKLIDTDQQRQSATADQSQQILGTGRSLGQTGQSMGNQFAPAGGTNGPSTGFQAYGGAS